MSLAAGSRIGPYEVLGSLGAGGMGEVYRATDTTLGRQVAIKILPDAFAADPDRLARFEREAKTLASLNHPHIAAIHGFEKSAGMQALVMELVEGEDLSQRIARGAIPLDEALPLAKQIAEALEAAHEQGIIHRDLKPANIKVRADGTVKVLDFGLAKAIEPPAASGVTAMNSPTLSIHATQAGIILGTAAYMAPEQARGRAVDQRADIWAFGAILFEMLSGKGPFAGETVTDILARVMERDPDWSALPAATPGNVMRVLRRCLEKNPARRLRHVADARLELEDTREPQAAAIATSSSAWARALPWGVAVLALVATAAVATRPSASVASREPQHFDIVDPPGVRARQSNPGTLALSPDGSRLAFIGLRDGVRHVFVRDVENPDVRLIPDSAGTNAMVFAPNGSALAVTLAGGEVGIFQFGDTSIRLLPTTGDNTGAMAWGSRGLVFQRRSELWLVDPADGTLRQLTTLDASRGEVQHALPIWLDDRVLVFTTLTDQAGTERVETVTLDVPPRRSVVMERASRAMWSPTGHLLFGRDGALLAAPFDLDTLKPTGPTSIVLPQGTASNNAIGTLTVAVSRDGTLAYGLPAHGNSQIVLVSRDGSSRPVDVPAGRFLGARVSPDGLRLAIDDSQMTTAIIDLARGTKVTPLPPAAGSGFANWNSDGTRLMFRHNSRPHSISADGNQNVTPVKDSNANDYPSGAGPGPDDMIGVRTSTDLGAEIYQFSLSGAYPPKALVSGRGYQGGAQLSPDGRWLLYQSDETGQPEIFVRAYPALDRAWQVSVGGGVQPRWGAGGREVFYRTGNPMVAVTFDGHGAAPVLGKPQVLFDQPFEYGQGISIANYDVLPDGRFVMLRAEPGGAPFHVIRHWADGLKDK
jgi:serine/threonine protein kinase/Tol biopolymer transport system component